MYLSVKLTKLFSKLTRCKARSTLIIGIADYRRVILFKKGIKVSNLIFCKELHKICLGNRCIYVECLFSKRNGIRILFILKCKFSTHSEVVCVSICLVNATPCSIFFLFLIGYNLVYATNDIIDKADLAHILCLQVSKLARHIVGIHITVARDKKS